MSSSNEVTLLRGDTADAASVLMTPELRAGSWTRFGDSNVLGDQITEQTLAGLAESTRTAARSQGYAVGWAEGRREAAAKAAAAQEQAQADRQVADARREGEHRDAVVALERAAEEFHQALAAAVTRVEDDALFLARELTCQLTGHELRTAQDPGGDVVRRALAVLPDGLPVTLRLHPDVMGSDAVTGLAGQGIQVIADASLQLHDAWVEADEHVIDLRIETALARVREVLS